MAALLRKRGAGCRKLWVNFLKSATPPAYGLYARHVHGLDLNNVRFKVEKSDLQPAVAFDHVEDAVLNGFGATGNSQAEAVLRFVGASDVLITAPRVLTPMGVFL